ncbi:MAG: amidohydrolase family protein, partial [Acidimicrobiales bacterium]
LANMSAYANRPLNWNVLTVDAASAGLIERQLQPSRLARSNGGRVVALTMPVTAEMNMSFATFCSLWLIPGWREVLTLPLAEKARALRDPQVRARLFANAQGTPFEHRVNFASYVIGTTAAAENQPLEGRLVADIARERGIDPFAAIVDIVIADNFTTVLWPLPMSDTDADWAVRRDLWSNEDVLLGGSDAGAHLDRMLGSPYPTRFLADSLRGRKLVSLERAVQLMTDIPARLFGLRDRGRLAAGAFADLVVFDPDTVGSEPARRVSDLPGNSLRLTSGSTGIEHVLVNGVEAIAQGQSTGALAGTLLRSGRDTDTVATH